MFIPCPFTLHVGCNSLYDPIRKIQNGKQIIGIPIVDLSPVLVSIHVQAISSANVGHMYQDTSIRQRYLVVQINLVSIFAHILIPQGKYQLLTSVVLIQMILLLYISHNFYKKHIRSEISIPQLIYHQIINLKPYYIVTIFKEPRSISPSSPWYNLSEVSKIKSNFIPSTHFLFKKTPVYLNF